MKTDPKMVAGLILAKRKGPLNEEEEMEEEEEEVSSDTPVAALMEGLKSDDSAKVGRAIRLIVRSVLEQDESEME